MTTSGRLYLSISACLCYFCALEIHTSAEYGLVKDVMPIALERSFSGLTFLTFRAATIFTLYIGILWSDFCMGKSV
jgi:hypothetical protein